MTIGIFIDKYLKEASIEWLVPIKCSGQVLHTVMINGQKFAYFGKPQHTRDTKRFLLTLASQIATLEEWPFFRDWAANLDLDEKSDVTWNQYKLFKELKDRFIRALGKDALDVLINCEG